MGTIVAILIGLVAVEHIWFMILEMFLWTRPIGLKTFGSPLEVAQQSAVLAANQGLYNGFLAAGLLWSLLPGHTEGTAIRLFFLGCVVVAGVYGGITVSRRILIVQGGPAALAMLLILLAK